jgi:hypothetical protein
MSADYDVIVLGRRLAGRALCGRLEDTAPLADG